MSELSYQLEMGHLDIGELKLAAQSVAAMFEGVSVEVEKEAPDTVTCFFSVPQEEGSGHFEVEISAYDMGRDGIVLNMEAGDGDNNEAWDDACELIERMAEELDGESLD